MMKKNRIGDTRWKREMGETKTKETGIGKNGKGKTGMC